MEMEYTCIETVCPAHRNRLKNEHFIRVNKMSPNEIFMYLINPPNEKSENQKIDSKACVQRNEKEAKK